MMNSRVDGLYQRVAATAWKEKVSKVKERNFIRRNFASLRRLSHDAQALITDSLIKKRFGYARRPITELRMGVGHFNELNDSLAFFRVELAFVPLIFPTPSSKRESEMRKKSEARGTYTHRMKSSLKRQPLFVDVKFSFYARFLFLSRLTLSHSLRHHNFSHFPHLVHLSRSPNESLRYTPVANAVYKNEGYRVPRNKK